MMEATNESLLPPYVPGTTYGNLGYRGAMCDRAIRSDNAPMLKECIEREFIDASSEMLDGKTVLQFCLQKVERHEVDDAGKPVRVMRQRAPRCAGMLRGLGWTIPQSKAEAFGIR